MGETKAAPSAPARSAETLYNQLRTVGLDSARVYRIREVSFDRAALHISLDDGTIAFTQDVAGRVTGAFFEGEGEVLLIPPNQVERASMALFTGAAILEERFLTAYFRFNDNTFAELQHSLRPADNAQEFVSQWNPTAQNLAEDDALRLLVSFSRTLPVAGGQAQPPDPPTGPAAEDRMLHARLQGRKLGTFDLYYDSLAPEQVRAGQLKTVEGESYYDVWTSVALNRKGEQHEDVSGVTGEEGFTGPVRISRYSIRTQVMPPTRLNVEAWVQLDVRQGGQRAVLFELSRFLQITQVDADGHPVEFIHNPALEGTQRARRGNDIVAVVFPRPLQPGQETVLHFVYGGEVLSEAGGGLLYVGARGTWYPNLGLVMSNFDLEFHYPPGWTLVATGTRAGVPAGEPSPNMPEGEQVSRWVSERPIPIAGFNLGKYERAVAHAGDVTIETYAASGVERAFPKGPPEAVIPALPTAPGTRETPIVIVPPPPSPARNAQTVADRSARAIEFYARRFGPYPYSELALTQMPGGLSQGWPSLIFLSSLSFLSPVERGRLHMSPLDVTLNQIIVAHETAHQWWGDLITWSGYRDQWIMEALANYSSLMLLESDDPSQFHAVMEKFRDDLLHKNNQGVPLMDAGPVTLSSRLSCSQFPVGYEAISYGRGTWLLHMLRNMMRDAERKSGANPAVSGAGTQDEPFVRALHKLRDQYQGRSLTTRDLVRVFEEELPPSLWYDGRKSLDWFYQGWVNGTAVPRFDLQGVKYTDKVGSTTVTGTILQKFAPKDLVTPVPLYAVLSGKSVFLGRVFADGPETQFRLTAPAGTRKVVPDPDHTLLSRAK
ncbi:MAG: hypothetical protein LAN83_04200 [Acidobacteriia bacterium]|nr:hypothetical protein [Terriglobia bacterium]